jgi:hypothetical protein
LTQPEQSHLARQRERARRESLSDGAASAAEKVDEQGEEPA